MLRSSLFIAAAIAVLATVGQVNGFVVPQNDNRQATVLSAQSSRRAFGVASMGAAFAALTVGAPAAFALDDLDMPSAEAQAKSDDEARLKVKADLKAKAARPKSYAESVQKELGKKKDAGMTQTEKRNAMCEELGRGC